MQASRDRYRIPDICVMRGGRPSGRIITTAPFLCVEILSPDDPMPEMQQRIDDYLTMGVTYAWVVNPETRDCYIYTTHGIERSKQGILRTLDPDITLDLNEVLE